MNVKLVRWCTDVTLLIPVGSGDTKNICDHHVMPDIKLSVIVKQWTINIKLNNKSIFLFCNLYCFLWWIILRSLLIFSWLVTFSIGLLNDGIEFINLIDNSDSSALIGILAWFYNPNISRLFLSIQISFLLLLLFLLFYLFGSFLMILTKSDVLRILKSIFYMKS